MGFYLYTIIYTIYNNIVLTKLIAEFWELCYNKFQLKQDEKLKH